MNSRQGEIFFNTQGCKMKIIDYIGSHNCTIQFEDGYVRTNVKYSDIKRGSVKNPMYPSLYGVGYYGIGDYFSKKSYSKWGAIFDRCYNENSKESHLTYKDVTACEEWHNYQNFAEWFDKNYQPEVMCDWEFDKDILFKGNKIYSPETCCFVPREINVLFTKRQNHRGQLPIGVTLHKKNRVYIANCMKAGKRTYLGSFTTPEEAFQAYKTAKEAYIKEVADKWRGQITEECYKALYNYKVEITD